MTPEAFAEKCLQLRRRGLSICEIADIMATLTHADCLTASLAVIPRVRAALDSQPRRIRYRGELSNAETDQDFRVSL